jgi:hypothetical protein
MSSGVNFQQVTVDVPEDRVAEFHAFFARFLAGRSGRAARGPWGRHGRPHRGRHGHGCARHRGAQEDTSTERGAATEISEV